MTRRLSVNLIILLHKVLSQRQILIKKRKKSPRKMISHSVTFFFLTPTDAPIFFHYQIKSRYFFLVTLSIFVVHKDLFRFFFPPLHTAAIALSFSLSCPLIVSVSFINWSIICAVSIIDKGTGRCIWTLERQGHDQNQPLSSSEKEGVWGGGGCGRTRIMSIVCVTTRAGDDGNWNITSVKYKRADCKVFFLTLWVWM